MTVFTAFRPGFSGRSRVGPVVAIVIAASMLAGCDAAMDEPNAPGDMSDNHPFSKISETERITATGTEPFWNAKVAGGQLTYSTPENIEGTTVAVERFAGRAGVSYTGTLDGQDVVLMITDGSCNDGMSDRTYPFNATIGIGTDQRTGCAWSDGSPFEGPESP